MKLTSKSLASFSLCLSLYQKMNKISLKKSHNSKLNRKKTKSKPNNKKDIK